MSESDPESAVDAAMRANMEKLIAVVVEAHADVDSRTTTDLIDTVPPETKCDSDGLAAEPWHLIESPPGPDTMPPTPKGRDRTTEVPMPEGSRLGRYVVLSLLGRGGMGTVLKAYDGSLDRAVAIKLLHRSTMAREAERLRREAQALAKLSHPNVVQVYEVGQAEGQWFIAMELVQGQTLRGWHCERHDWRECVEVYLQAGRGLAAAHAEGLVHRDFKPDNCIIDEQGRVRVLDFGLVHQSTEYLESKSERSESEPESLDPPTAESRLDLDPVSRTMAPLTSRGTVMGTPGYMALEHLEGHGTDARSDQFSFCVSLCEALYGERPFQSHPLPDLTEAMLGGRLRPAPKGSAVPSELRTMLQRGLAADPDARWPSMEALLSELQRLVTPPRSRWPVVLGLGLMGGLGLLGVGLAYEADMGQRCTGARTQMDGIWDDDRRQAVETAILGTERSYAAETWQRIQPRLDAYADAWANAHTEACEATSVRAEQSQAVMDLRMRCLDRRRTTLLAMVDVLADADADVVKNAVEFVAGLPPLDRCDDLKWLEEHKQRMPPPEDPDVAAAVEAQRAHLADVEAMYGAGRTTEALEQLEAVVQQAEALDYPPLLAETLYWRGELRNANAEYAKAEQDLQQAHILAIGHHHDAVALDTAQALTSLVGCRLDRHAEGRLLGEVTALPLAQRSGEPTKIAHSLTNLGSVFFCQGEYDEAKRHHQRVLGIREQALGPDHPDVAHSLTSLGQALARQGKYPEAVRHHQRALAILEQALGPSHPGVTYSLHNLGNVLERQGEYQEAERHYQRALTIRENALGPDHPDVATSLANLGVAHQRQGKNQEAIRYHQRALAIREKALGPDHSMVARSLGNLGNVYARQEKYEKAIRYQQRALAIREKVLGIDHPDLTANLHSLGVLSINQGEHEDAKRYLHRALALREKTMGSDHPLMVYPLAGLGRLAQEMNDPAAGRRHLERALSIHEATGVAPDQVAEIRYMLADTLWREGNDLARARALAEQARDAFVEYGPARKDNLARVEAWLATHQVQ